jgi:hypothetical protein
LADDAHREPLVAVDDEPGRPQQRQRLAGLVVAGDRQQPPLDPALDGRPGEIFTSRTVRDLVVGSDIALDDRGGHPLKGVEGGWQLFTVTRP